MNESLNIEISSVWRDVRPKLISALSARYQDIELAEDALSEAIIAAQTGWTAGLPENPSGWLYRVACRKAVDLIRKRNGQRKLQNHCKAEADVEHAYLSAEPDQPPENRLGFFFACAHPSLSSQAQISLILFHLGGLSTSQIASAFLQSPQTIQQRLKRARDKLKVNSVGYDIPQPSDWSERLPPVLSAVEIIYDKSYSNLSGGRETEALAREALILAQMLAKLMPDEVEVQSLCALLFSLEARRPARLIEGLFIPFNEQDITLWSQPHLRLAARFLERAENAIGRSLLLAGQFSIRAYIANLQMRERFTGQDNATQILGAYDDLLTLAPSPITEISRALIYKRVEGPKAALSRLKQIDFGKRQSLFSPWLLAKAECLLEMGQDAEAAKNLENALPLIEGEAERHFVRQKLAKLMAN